MYDYLKGFLTKITPVHITLEVAGIGYQILVAVPYSWHLGEEVQVPVHLVVREDSQLLYGFKDEAERSAFLQLISVSGIGPKSALAIIAADDTRGLLQAIEQSDVKYLTKFPGVGQKTAKQMILDLSGKLDLGTKDQPVSAGNQDLEEAIAALLALGYSPKEVKKIEKTLGQTRMDTQGYVRAGLKALMGK